MTQDNNRGARYRGGKARYQAKPRAGAGQAVGVRGLRTTGSYINEEWKNALKDRTRRLNIYREMREDIIIGTLLDAIKLPLLEASFTVEPSPNNTQGDQEAAEFIERNMGRMHKQVWRSHVSDCLDAIDFGFAIGEILLEKREDGRMWLKNFLYPAHR